MSFQLRKIRYRLPEWITIKQGGPRSHGHTFFSRTEVRFLRQILGNLDKEDLLTCFLHVHSF